METKGRATHKLIFPAIYFFVFLTGAAGLIYQVVWQKYLGRLLGSDTIAIAIIIGTFLGGLSLGYYLIGRLSARVKQHLKLYALLEALIGAWCLIFPWLFSGFAALTTGWSFDPPLLIIAQGVFASFVLFGVPTICMGATVPLLTRGISRNLDAATGVHARIYGVNTGGAFLGTLTAGFWLIPAYGLPATVMGTSALNLGTAAFFLLLSRAPLFGDDEAAQRPADQDDADAPGTEAAALPATSPGRRLVIYAVGFLSGFAVMTLENVLFRVSNLSFGSSSYSFSLVLSVFLLAIALGSYAVGKLRHIRRRYLFYNQFILALLLIGLYLALDLWPQMAHLIRIGFSSSEVAFWFYYGAVFLVLLVVLLPALFFTGATLPIAFHELKDDINEVGRHSGLLLSLNTLGALLGSLIGGVLLYYVLDNPRIFLTAVACTAVSCLLASLHLSSGYRAAAGALLAAAAVLLVTVPMYDARRFSIGTFRNRQELAHSYQAPSVFYARHLERQKILKQTDGPSLSLTVTESKFNPASRAVWVNGKCDSDTVEDIYTLRLSAHIPALLARNRKSAAVVGLGTGVTVGELTRYDSFERIDVAEISSEIIDAAGYFDHANEKLRHNPKVKIHRGDAFRVFGRSDRRWDLIISEPSNPWVTGVDSLFTRDFYQLVKAHLNPGGVLLQWVHVYASSHDMIGIITNTLAEQFRELHVFFGTSGDLVVLASDEPLSKARVDGARQVLAQNPRAAAALAELGIKSVEGLLVRQVWGNAVIDLNFFDRGIQTLDHPRLHYIAGKDFYKSKVFSTRDIYTSSSAFFPADYLLFRAIPGWNNMKLEPERLDELLGSVNTTPHKGRRMPLPMRSSLRLKAHISAPGRFPLSEREKRVFRTNLIVLSMKLPADENGWASANLHGRSDRFRARALLGHVKRTRRWLVAYPLTGLKQLLARGARGAAEPKDRNWHALNLARLLVLEGAPGTALTPLLSGLSRNKAGALLLDAEGEVSRASLHRMLGRYHRGLAARVPARR